MKETGKPMTSPKMSPKSGETVSRTRRKLSSVAQIDEIDEASNEILDNYERNAAMMDTTLKKLRRRNHDLLYAYVEAMSDFETMHRTSLCVERYLAPSLNEKIGERDALQADMDELMKEEEGANENESRSDDDSYELLVTERSREKDLLDSPTLENAEETSAASDLQKSRESESEVDTPGASVHQDMEEATHTTRNGRNKSAAPIGQQKHHTSNAMDESAKDLEVPNMETLIIEPLRRTDEPGKEGRVATHENMPIALRLEYLKKKLLNLRNSSENSWKTLFQMVSENAEMGKCFDIQDIAKIRERFETANLIARENQKAFEKYKSEQCEIKKEISTLFQYVFTTKLKESNAMLDKRIKRLEQDLLEEIETEKVVDANIKRLVENIAMLTAQYRVMELRTRQLAEVEETCRDFGKVLECRQGSLEDKEYKIEELKNFLNEKLELNAQKLKEMVKRMNYVMAARRTINECARLVERAMQGMNCADAVGQSSFSLDSKTLMRLIGCIKNKTTLQPTNLTRFSGHPKTLVRTETTNSYRESNTLAQTNQTNPTDYCDSSKTLGGSSLSDSSCEDSKDLIRTVLKKLRHLLPLIGDSVTSLSYLLRNVNEDNEDHLMKFSMLDLQMYHKHAN